MRSNNVHGILQVKRIKLALNHEIEKLLFTHLRAPN